MREKYRKTPLVFQIGVVLFCAMMVSFHMMGGLYARYSAAAIGDSSARAAKIDCTVSYTPQTFGDKTIIKDTYYAIVSEFTVYNSGEVAYNYTLTLSGSDILVGTENEGYINYGAVVFSYPLSTTPDFGEFGVGNALKDVSVTGENIYYAFMENGKYIWREIKSGGDMNQITLSPETELGISEIHYYKILYFVNIKKGFSENDITTIECPVLYSITCEQID